MLRILKISRSTLRMSLPKLMRRLPRRRSPKRLRARPMLIRRRPPSLTSIIRRAPQRIIRNHQAVGIRNLHPKIEAQVKTPRPPEGELIKRRAQIQVLLIDQSRLIRRKMVHLRIIGQNLRANEKEKSLIGIMREKFIIICYVYLSVIFKFGRKGEKSMEETF